MKNGNEAHAVVMAQAITQPEIKPHNRPILAAVAVAETGADPTIRNTGWKNRHSGVPGVACPRPGIRISVSAGPASSANPRRVDGI